jgi:cob(I)alamin adenosyltransferase
MAVSKSNVYTRTGDSGITSLYNGERCHKSTAVFQALGDLDELNSHIGLVRRLLLNKNIEYFNEVLDKVQHILLDIGSYIATPRSTTNSGIKLKRTDISSDYTDVIEKHIDSTDSELPKLTNFIIPFGDIATCNIHICRCVCRRTERSLLLIKSEDMSPNILKFINRLSDLFFVMARYSCYIDNQSDDIHKK